MYDKLKDTMFKKGRKPHNTRQECEESKSTNGYTYVKIADNDWRLKHRVVYENVNGPIPADHIVVFKDNNHDNFDINNLELITKSENMLRNTLHQYPESIQQVIKLNNKLKKQINAKQN
jgi:ribosomal protein S28E/S33